MDDHTSESMTGFSRPCPHLKFWHTSAGRSQIVHSTHLSSVCKPVDVDLTPHQSFNLVMSHRDGRPYHYRLYKSDVVDLSQTVRNSRKDFISADRGLSSLSLHQLHHHLQALWYATLIPLLQPDKISLADLSENPHSISVNDRLRVSKSLWLIAEFPDMHIGCYSPNGPFSRSILFGDKIGGCILTVPV